MRPSPARDLGTSLQMPTQHAGGRSAEAHVHDMQAPVESLRPGDVRVAEIIGIHLYHGAIVELGTQYHGLIPVCEPQWPAVLDMLPLEGKVKVRVHAVRIPHSVHHCSSASSTASIPSLCAVKPLFAVCVHAVSC
jgi:hypothetical protein